MTQKTRFVTRRAQAATGWMVVDKTSGQPVRHPDLAIRQIGQPSSTDDDRTPFRHIALTVARKLNQEAAK